MTEFKLRDYQERVVERAFKVPDNPIFCAATGSGKTIMQAFIARKALEQGYHTAILTPRKEIFLQTQNSLSDVVGPHNVATLRSGQSWNAYKPVHVVSWPTLVARMKKSVAWMPKVDLVLVDEAHLSMAPKVLEILHYYQPRAKVIGFTATPARKNGKGLGEFYTEIVPVTTVPKLIADGFLNPNEYWAGTYADVTGVQMAQGDYNNKQLSDASMPLIGDVVENWLRLASDRHTIVFAVDIGHAEGLTDRFLEAGVSAACIHSELEDTRRDDVVMRFKSREIQVLVNVTIASYGFDAPSVDCVVLARRTKSIVLHLQMLGRGMRPDDGKRATMVLDHANNVRTLGEAEDLYRWTLDGGKKAVSNVTKEKVKNKNEELRACEGEGCGHMFSGRRDCPKCGWEAPFARADVSTVDADLVLISEARNKPVGKGFPNAEMFYRMLKHHSDEKGYKTGFAAVKFKEKTGEWPANTWTDLAAVPPSAQVRSWLKGMQIRYAKRKKRTGPTGKAASN